VLRGARTLAYLCDMSRVLRSVRLASDLPRDVFQQPASEDSQNVFEPGTTFSRRNECRNCPKWS